MKNEPFQQFCQSAYDILPKRVDTILNLVDALTIAKCIISLVALNQSPLVIFKWCFLETYAHPSFKEAIYPIQFLVFLNLDQHQNQDYWSTLV